MRTRRVLIQWRANPARPAAEITDRAKRYRANSRENRPLAPKRCGFCGSRKNVGVHHLSGDESDGSPANLFWACKSCNGKVGHLMRRAGLGKLTNQYNPGRASGSKRQILDAYGAAIKVMRGVWPGDVAKAVSTIRSTPRELRSEYTSRTWSTRRAVYGPSGRAGGADAVPF